jgi:hypothetical protein
MSRDWGLLPLVATGEDLDEIARDYGLRVDRRADEAGGIPDLRTGVPMESDESLRKRLVARIMGEDIIEGEITGPALPPSDA